MQYNADRKAEKKRGSKVAMPSGIPLFAMPFRQRDLLRLLVFFSSIVDWVGACTSMPLCAPAFLHLQPIL